jgi:hypothetical protein
VLGRVIRATLLEHLQTTQASETGHQRDAASETAADYRSFSTASRLLTKSKCDPNFYVFRAHLALSVVARLIALFEPQPAVWTAIGTLQPR